METGQHRVTSADVARASGVSRATVSYVLNNDPRQSIPLETRERVLKAARMLGYRPFTPARILRAGHSQIVLAVLPFEQIDPGLARGIKELEARLAEHDFTLICYVGVHPLTGKMHPSSNVTPGVVVSYADEADPAIAAFLRQFQVPVLSVMDSKETNRAMGKLQVSHLVERGRRRILFAASERQDVQFLAQARLSGVRQGCIEEHEHALEPPAAVVVPSSRPGAREAIATVLARYTRADGICCYNDEVAFAVLAALSDEGIRVPEEIAVIGCDDIPLAQFSIPPLTTIHFDNEQSRSTLVENIVAASRGEPLQEMPRTVLTVIVRQSA